MAVKREPPAGIFGRPRLALFAGPFPERPPEPDPTDPEAVADWEAAMVPWRAAMAAARQDFDDTIAAHNAGRAWTFEGQIAGIEEAAKLLLNTEAGHDAASRVLSLLRRARESVAAVPEPFRDNAEQAARFAFELAELTREWDLAVDHEPAAGRGHKMRMTGKNGADQRHGDENSRAQRVIARCATVDRHEAAGMSRSAAVTATAMEHRTSERTIYRELKARENSTDNGL